VFPGTSLAQSPSPASASEVVEAEVDGEPDVVDAPPVEPVIEPPITDAQMIGGTASIAATELAPAKGTRRRKATGGTATAAKAAGTARPRVRRISRTKVEAADRKHSL
jgi:hypothetical protein